MPALIRTLNRSNSLALSPDGKLIASAISTQINLLDAKTGAPLAQSREFPNAFVRFSPGGKWLLAKTVDRKLGLLETNNGLTPAKKLIIKKNTQPQDRGVCMTPDGRKIVNLVYEDNMLGCISVWDASAWTEQRHFEGENNVFTHIQCCRDTRKCFISGYRRPAGKTGGNRSFYLWFDPAGGAAEFTETRFRNNEVFVYAGRGGMIFSYRPHSLGAGKIHFLSASGGKPAKPATIEAGQAVSDVVLSHDGKKAAVVYSGKTTLCEFPSFKKIADLDTLNSFGTVVFTPDDRQLIIGTWKKTFVYDITT